MIKQFIKSNRFLFNLALDYKESRLNNKNKTKSLLNEEEKSLLNDLNNDGIAVVPNFFTTEECSELVNIFENLDSKYKKKIENDSRIFGIEKLSDLHKKLFYDNNFMKKVGEAYVCDELVLQTTMAAKIVSDSSVKFGSGGSWHRDSFSRQFKAVIYLDDVTIKNGPFMYIKGSHKMENIKKVISKLKNHTPGDYRYSNDEIDKVKEILNEEITYLTAPKGTLVLADIRGLHTGMPIENGHRYALFNYYVAKSHYQSNNNIEKLSNY